MCSSLKDMHPTHQMATEGANAMSLNKQTADVASNHKKKPRERPATTATKKLPLSEQLGGDLAKHLMSSAMDTGSMNIIQRLQHLEQGAVKTPSIQTSTIVVAASLNKHGALSCAAQIPGPRQSSSTSSTVSINSTNQTSLTGSPAMTPTYPKRKSNDIHTFTLHDFTAISALSSLVERFGRVSHMGILDSSYSFFMTKNRQAALYYKVRNNIAVVGGDPLCDPDDYENLLEEFRCLRKHRRWGIVFIGATDQFAAYASTRRWVTMRFGTERVLNPLTNPVLLEKEQKRMLVQNRQLIDPQRGGITVLAYAPAQGRDEILEQKLRHVYDSWRNNRNDSGQPQAYMTVFDPFAIPALMTYLYTTDQEGQCNGFAALRKIGANNGYHIDPYCATPDAPRGITDLLIFSAMSLLQQAGIGYLSLGFEPTLELDEVKGLSRPMTAITKTCYRHAFRHLPIGGKKGYHDKFRPDPALDSGLHIIYPDGAPSLQDALATLHFANIEVGGLLKREMSTAFTHKERKEASK